MSETIVTPTDLRRLREAYGTQADAAEALGVGLRTINRAETEEKYPRRQLLAWAVRGLLAEAGQAPTVGTESNGSAEGGTVGTELG